ncbi:MAG: hemerythrin family protein [Pseudomonadales bacterium]|nr:hemerythrin family protein [Pseudomonadales bacterium]
MELKPSMNTQAKYQLTSLNYDVIDSDHLAFLELVTQLIASSDAEFPRLFALLLEHTEEHFERENNLMDTYQYPAIGEHRGEHHRVLGEYRQFKTRVDRGLIPFGRAFIKDRLLPWFELHITTMDSALVAHIKAR